MQNKPQPNYITQDDETELANLLFQELLPKIHDATIQINAADQDLHEANKLHHHLYNQSLPKIQVHSTTTPLGITSNAVYHLLGTHIENQHHNHFVPTALASTTPLFSAPVNICEPEANGVVHPITKETITKYEKLANDPVMQHVWRKAMCKELGRLAQGYDD
jgi:hypothetical protein